jgi:hypothetical protein
MAASRGSAVAPRAGAKLFFYGTLLDPDIQKRVIGRVLTEAALLPATLAGFRRVRAAGKWFPILVPGLNLDRVAGAVALGLSAAEIARIVAYENDGYALKRVTARLAGGKAARALVFLPIKGAGNSLKPTAEPWDLAQWQEREKPRVLRLGLWP